MHNFQNAFLPGSQKNHSNVMDVYGGSKDEIDRVNYKSLSRTKVLTVNPAIFVSLQEGVTTKSLLIKRGTVLSFLW